MKSDGIKSTLIVRINDMKLRSLFSLFGLIERQWKLSGTDNQLSRISKIHKVIQVQAKKVFFSLRDSREITLSGGDAT
jgi:hypothetical protein